MGRRVRVWLGCLSVLALLAALPAEAQNGVFARLPQAKLYNLYGGPLTEITDFDLLFYCSGGAGAQSPK